jgi:integrase
MKTSLRYKKMVEKIETRREKLPGCNSQGKAVNLDSHGLGF